MLMIAFIVNFSLNSFEAIRSSLQYYSNLLPQNGQYLAKGDVFHK